MGNIVAKSNDPLYRLEQIYDEIYSAKYPNEASILNDPLRGTLQNLYGCNLNMYDTHRIQFAKPQGIGIVNTGVVILEPETFFVYEGEGNDILFTFSDHFNKDMEIFGMYPEGILIGLLDCNMRDPEYRKKNAFIFYTQMFNIARNYLDAMYPRHENQGYAYRAYLDVIPGFFAFKKMIDSDITIEILKESDDIEIPSDTEYLFKDKDNFIKIMNTHNYEKIYKYWRSVPQIVFDKEPKMIHSDDLYPEGMNPNFDTSDYSGMRARNINEEFKEKYDSLKKSEEEEKKEMLQESAKGIVEGILDNFDTKYRNDLDKNHDPKSGREFHVYMYNVLEDESMDEIGICVDAKSTKTQLDISANFIYTTNTHFVSTDLIRKGYRIFVHMDRDRVHEIKIGENDWTDREIKWAHKLETFLYNGEMQ